MTRKPARRREPTPKQEGEQIIEAATTIPELHPT